ncbi:hypothetical protein OAP14_10650 [Aliiglaciecola sp.]|nr:hypothetical protein [Aliiglaciecola sp.]
MKFVSSLKSVLIATGLLFSLSAQSTVILSTDFDGRTVSGVTASNLGWVTNGITSLCALTVEETSAVGPALALFDIGASQNRFAVNRNLHNEGSWYVDLDFNVASDISLVS